MESLKQLQALPWHARVLVLVLLVWGGWTAIAVVWAFALTDATENYELLDYYLYFAPPMLMLAAAYALAIASRWMLLPLSLVPFAQTVIALREYPNMFSLVGRSVEDTYFSILPLPVKVSLAFALACAGYIAYLRRAGTLR